MPALLEGIYDDEDNGDDGTGIKCVLFLPGINRFYF